MRAIFGLIIAFGLALFLDVGEARAMRCGTELVSRGDTTLDVRGMCGEPDDAITRIETRTQTVVQRVNGVLVAHTVTYTVEIREWLYDFGRQRLVRRVVFEDGRVVDIDTLGRGR